MGVSVRLDWQGEQVAAKVHDAAEEGLMEATGTLLEKANAVVPLDNSDLQKSGQPDVDTERLQATVSYGQKIATAYARVQHENEDYKHDPGRKYHYLKDPFEANEEKLQRQIAEKIRQALK